MASPTIDGSGYTANTTWKGTITNNTVNVSTTTAGDLIVLLLYYSSGNTGIQRNVLSVLSAHLTWTKYTEYKPGLTNKGSIEVWTAVASGTLTAEVVTVAVDGSINAGDMLIFGVKGLASTSAPMDPNASIPAKQSGTGDVNLGYSTSNADDLLIAFMGGDTSTAAGAVFAGSISGKDNSGDNAGGTLEFCSFIQGKAGLSAPQTSQTVSTSGAGGATHTLAVLLAFTADAAPTNVNATKVSAAGAANPVTAEINSNLAGVSAAGAANPVAISIQDTAAKASSAAIANAVIPRISNSLVGVSSAAIARNVGLAITGRILILGVSGAGHANPVGLHIDSNVRPAGVHATGAAHPVTPGVGAQIRGVPAGPTAGIVRGFVTPIDYLPLYRLMRNTPVAAIGSMDNTPVALIGTLRAAAPEPFSIAIPIIGVSAQGHAATVVPTRRVRIHLVGVSSAAKANFIDTSG